MSLFTGFSDKNYVYMVLIIILYLLLAAESIVRIFVVVIPNTTPSRIDLVYTQQNRNVAIGDSHIYRGFIHSDNFLNLGQGGTTIPMMRIIMEQYFMHKKPGKIIIEASPQFFSRRHLSTGKQDYENFFTQNNSWPVKFYLLDPGIGGELGKTKTFSKIYQNISGLPPEIKMKWENIDHSERLNRIKKRLAKQRPRINKASLFIDEYRQMVRFLISRGAEVCLLRTPVDEMYLDLIQGESSFYLSIEIFKDIAKELGVKFVDFRELDYDFSLNKFMNQDHLNPDASADFAPLVDKQCFDEVA